MATELRQGAALRRGGQRACFLRRVRGLASRVAGAKQLSSDRVAAAAVAGGTTIPSCRAAVPVGRRRAVAVPRDSVARRGGVPGLCRSAPRRRYDPGSQEAPGRQPSARLSGGGRAGEPRPRLAADDLLPPPPSRSGTPRMNEKRASLVACLALRFFFAFFVYCKRLFCSGADGACARPLMIVARA